MSEQLLLPGFGPEPWKHSPLPPSNSDIRKVLEVGGLMYDITIQDGWAYLSEMPMGDLFLKCIVAYAAGLQPPEIPLLAAFPVGEGLQRKVWWFEHHHEELGIRRSNQIYDEINSELVAQARKAFPDL